MKRIASLFLMLALVFTLLPTVPTRAAGKVTFKFAKRYYTYAEDGKGYALVKIKNGTDGQVKGSFNLVAGNKMTQVKFFGIPANKIKYIYVKLPSGTQKVTFAEKHVYSDTGKYPDADIKATKLTASLDVSAESGHTPGYTRNLAVWTVVNGSISNAVGGNDQNYVSSTSCQIPAEAGAKYKYSETISSIGTWTTHK